MARKTEEIDMLRWLCRFLPIVALSAASATASDGNAMKAFHDAVHAGETETVRTMLAADSQLAISANKNGFQPIHLLDMYPDEDVLNLLLANGADINAVNDEGVTILHIVTDPDAVSLLVRKGANVEARDKRGWTPLMMQTNNQENGPDVVASLLAHGADPNAVGNDGETALSFATETGSESFSDILTANGAKK
nr:ankyrin repeat domain-containing protein [Agrobacterium sp. rho-13.3]MDX8307435.1 ankyrin repeat domain-containing protein [Agrobacterium sp. rho-13.3]